MKILLDQLILDLDDLPIIVDNAGLTLRKVIQSSLINQLPSDQSMTGEKKLKAFNIAIDSRGESLDLKAEDLAFVKSRIGMAYGPLVVGRAFTLMEPT